MSQVLHDELPEALPLEVRSPAADFWAGLICEHSLPHRGNDSLDSQVATLPYESSSLCTHKANTLMPCRWCRRRQRRIADFHRKSKAPKGPGGRYDTFVKKPPTAVPLLRKGLSSALSGSSFHRKEPALRDYHLCLHCCMTKSRSLLPLEGGGAEGDEG